MVVGEKYYSHLAKIKSLFTDSFLPINPNRKMFLP